MHQKIVKNIANALREVAKKAESPSQLGKLPMKAHDDVSYCLPPDASSLYSEQVRSILGYADYSMKFSEQHLSKRLDAIFAEILKNNDLDVEDEIQNLLRECENFEKRSTVYISLEGVQTNITMRIGNVWITPGGSNFISLMEEKANSVIVTFKQTQNSKQKIAATLKQEFQEEFTNNCAIVFTVNAEPVRAIERAREEARFAIDLMRLVSKISIPFKEDVRIGLKGEKLLTRRAGFVFTKKGYYTTSDYVGSIHCLTLDENTIDRAEKNGLLQLSDRYYKNKLSSLDNILIRSIHWLSVALIQDEPESAIITLIVALECMFKADKGSSIASTVSESVAFLLSNEKDGRLRISAKIRDFYAKRSALAHGGKKAVTDSEKTLLVKYVVVSILTILNHKEISNKKDLTDWIEAKKFG